MQLRPVLAVLAAAMLQVSAYAALPTTADSRQAAVAAPAEQSSADQGDKPNFPAQTFPLRGDTFDPWCKGVTTAINVALCGDDELRRLAIQRLQAFDAAGRRLTQDQRKALAADQNGWAMSYPQGCGLPPNVAPSLPLAQATRECLAKAGRERLAYLQAYGSPAAGSNPPAASEPPAAGSQPAAASPAAAPQPVASQLNPAARQPLAAQLPVTDPQSSATTAPPAPPTAPPAAGKPPAADASASAAETPASSQPPQPAKGSTDNPLASRVGSLGTLQGKAAFAIALLAVFAVGIWIGGARRHARGRAEDRSGANTRG